MHWFVLRELRGFSFFTISFHWYKALVLNLFQLLVLQSYQMVFRLFQDLHGIIRHNIYILPKFIYTYIYLCIFKIACYFVVIVIIISSWFQLWGTYCHHVLFVCVIFFCLNFMTWIHPDLDAIFPVHASWYIAIAGGNWASLEKKYNL